MEKDSYTDGDHQRFRTALSNYRSVLQAGAQRHLDRAEYAEGGLLLVMERLAAQLGDNYMLAVQALLPPADVGPDEPDDTPPLAAKPKKGAEHRHKFVDGVCACGKPKGVGGRPPKAASPTDAAFAGKVDPPSHDLPLRLLLVSANPACSVGGPHAPSTDRRAAHCIRCGDKVFIVDNGNMAAADAHADGALGSSGVRR